MKIPLTPQQRAAAAIANARGNRRGAPAIVNILDMLPPKLLQEVNEEADAVLETLGYAEMLEALKAHRTADCSSDSEWHARSEAAIATATGNSE